MVMRARTTREKTVRSRSLRSIDLFVAPCELGAIKTFIETHHYSHSVFGVTASRCFSVTYQDELAGGAIFGLPAGVGVAAKYADGGNLLELRRFALHDKAPRNSESRALGVMFRTLRREGYTRILSYADPMHGHSGVIYKATGFEYRTSMPGISSSTGPRGSVPTSRSCVAVTRAIQVPVKSRSRPTVFARRCSRIIMPTMGKPTHATPHQESA